jgi:hypothetical protein
MIAAIRSFSLLLGLALCAGALADTRTYRYSLSHRSGEPRYAGEVTGASLKGKRYRVETDMQGRLLRAATLRDGKPISEVVYRYEENARLPSAFDNYTAGELRGSGRIQRNNQGERLRTEFLTVAGVLTNYTQRAYRADGVEASAHAPDGKKTDRYFYVYSAGGTLVRSRWYPSDSTYYETEMDENTGLTKSRRKMVAGKLEASNAYAYDADGDLTRNDIYDGKGTWYGVLEYRDGLKMLERYKFTGGGTQETRVVYDERRWPKEAKLYRNGALISTFTYDRLPNGRIKRTLATGPGGELMAEYPDQYVDKVTRTGQTIDRNSGIIHKKGNWW